MKKIAILLLTGTFLSVFCGAQSIRPLISNINTSFSPADSQVTLMWTVPDGVLSQISNLLVYKNSGSIISTPTLSVLSPIATLSPTSSAYTDSLSDSKSYYYAVVARLTDGTMYDVVIPTVNATVKSVAKEKKQNNTYVEPQNTDNIVTTRIMSNTEAPLRERPLPYLDIRPDTTQNQVLLPGTTQGDNVLTKQETFFAPYIFDEDKDGEKATGDDYSLYLIVNSVISQENWKSSQEELLKFLQINRSTSSTARANFYLAQTYYYQGDYRTALTHFQKAERLYPVNSKVWIEEVLNRFTIR